MGFGPLVYRIGRFEISYNVYRFILTITYPFVRLEPVQSESRGQTSTRVWWTECQQVVDDHYEMNEMNIIVTLRSFLGVTGGMTLVFRLRLATTL